MQEGLGLVFCFLGSKGQAEAWTSAMSRKDVDQTSEKSMALMKLCQHALSIAIVVAGMCRRRAEVRVSTMQTGLLQRPCAF